MDIERLREDLVLSRLVGEWLESSMQPVSNQHSSQVWFFCVYWTRLSSLSFSGERGIQTNLQSVHGVNGASPTRNVDLNWLVT